MGIVATDDEKLLSYILGAVTMEKKKFLITGVLALLVLSGALFLFIRQGAHPPEEEDEIPAEKEWTTFFWMCGDGNLGEFYMMETNIHYLEMVENSSDVNMLCVNDNIHDGDTQLLLIGKGGSIELNLTDVDPEWSHNELNMGDPEHLLKFLLWGVDNYPARKYNIHLSNHGGGWRGMCWDESSNDHLSLPEIREVCENFMEHTGRKVDIFSTEGCLVGMIEFAYELKDTCQYFVGGSTYGWGAEGDPDKGIWEAGNWQYDACWGRLAEEPRMSAEEFAIVMGETFIPYGPWRAPPFIPKQDYSDVMAVYNLSYIEPLAASVDALAKHLLDKVSGPGKLLNQALLINSVIGHPELPDDMHTESFSGQMDWIGIAVYTNYDLYDLAYMLTKPSAGTLRTPIATDVMRGIDDLVLLLRKVENGGHPDAHGVSIYIPYRSASYNSQYQDIMFARDTNWDEFLRAVHWG